MPETVDITTLPQPTIEFFALQGAKGEPGTRILGFSLGDGVSTISSGTKTPIQVPFACTIASWSLLCDPDATPGDIVVDVWKSSFASWPASVSDSITASAKPTISADVKATSSTLTGWTTTVTAGDVLVPYVEPGATLKRVTLQFVINPTS